MSKTPTQTDRIVAIEQRQEAMNKTIAKQLLRIENLESHDAGNKRFISKMNKTLADLKNDYEMFRGEMLRSLLGHFHQPDDDHEHGKIDAQAIKNNLKTIVSQDLQYIKQDLEELQASVGKLDLAARKWPAPIGELEAPISLHDKLLYGLVTVSIILQFVLPR